MTWIIGTRTILQERDDAVYETSALQSTATFGPGMTFEDAQAIAEFCPAVEAVSPQNYFTRRGGNVARYRDREATTAELIADLDDLKAQGLVNDDEYATKRQQILDEL